MTNLQKLRAMLKEPLDPDAPMPLDLIMPNWTRLPWDTQRYLIESQNSGRHYKPEDIRKYPGWAGSGAQVDPHTQKVCPVCFLVVRRRQLNTAFQGMCPRCGCRLSI